MYPSYDNLGFPLEILAFSIEILRGLPTTKKFQKVTVCL